MAAVVQIAGLGFSVIVAALSIWMGAAVELVLKVSVALSALIALVGLAYTSVCFLGKDEQLRIQQFTELVVRNGPGLQILVPFTYRTSEVVKAETLGTLDYVKLKDIVDGSERIERGPKLLFLGAYEKAEKRGQGISLTSNEYVLIANKQTGAQSVVRGPCVWFPEAQEEGKKAAGINLSNTDYVLIEDQTSGEKRIERGPCVWFPAPMESGQKGCGISLSSTEYVLVTDKESGEKSVQTGPCVWFPGPLEAGTKGAGISLNSTEYVLVEDKLTGVKRVEKGPCVWFPGPHDSGVKGAAISLGNTEYLIVEDKLTGSQSLVKGPLVWFPQAYDSASEIRKAIALQDDQYIKLKDNLTGRRWVQRGKALVFLEPTWTLETTSPKDNGIRKALVLKKYEYCRLIDNISGQVTTKLGEDTVFPGPDEDLLDGDKMSAIDVKVNEYVKIMDQATGDIRVVSGPGQVFLGPHEKTLDGGKQKAVEVDDEHAVLVRDKSSGQQRLVTENQLFFPGPHESIEEVRQLIKLADHEAIILKDKDGNFRFFYGSDEKRASDQPRSFFIPPSCEIVKLCWSRGRRREKRDLYISRFDCRAQYMSFEFNCRTKDNVELVLEGTFFWEVVDLPCMVRTTGDTSGDICSHARSQFIKFVAQVTLKEFMDDLNKISMRVYKDDTEFYSSRGVKVHSLEVTRYQCADDSTSEVLSQIIQETTNRMNRLSQAESENEVNLFRMQGQIEQERLNTELLEIQHQHSQSEARVFGLSEADRVSAFLSGLAETVPQIQERISMWQTLRKTDALSAISTGGASLYYTPNDVNLSIESRCGNQA